MDSHFTQEGLRGSLFYFRISVRHELREVFDGSLDFSIGQTHLCSP